MSGDSHKELLQLLDLLCEEAASPEQCSRLEQLVALDPAARQLYVDTLLIHGMLTWDAGTGLRALEQALPCATPIVNELIPSAAEEESRHSARRSDSAVPWAKTRVWKRLSIPAAACAAMLVAVLALQPRQSTEEPASTVRVRPANAPAPVVPVSDIVLPATPGVAQPTPADSIVVADSPAGDTILTDYSEPAVLAFINSELAEAWSDNGVSPSPRASDAQWVRRVYLDLAGRIPTTSEALTFWEDNSIDKDAVLIRKLLSGPEHSRHQATTWLNLLVGRSRERDAHRERLFAFLLRQFRENRPWSDSVESLLTATGSDIDNGAAGFLLAHMNNQAVPATAIVSRLFLGEQLQCSQCHQHPDVKQWPQERFWEFNAFFQQCQIVTRTAIDPVTGERTRLRELVDGDSGGPTYFETLQGVMQVTYPRYAGIEVDPAGGVNRRQELAKLLGAGTQSQLARAFVNRLWGQFLGRSFTQPVDDMGPHNPPSHPDLLAGLTEAFVQADYDVRQLITWICLSDAYRLDSSRTEHNAIDAPEQGELPLFSHMYLKPISAEQLYDSLNVASGQAPVSSAALSREREMFVQQFFTAELTEENGECTTFDGSLSQVLTMMNGPEISEALAWKQGNLLATVSQGSDSDSEKIRHLCLAVLSRYPAAEELQIVRQLLRKHVKSRTEQSIPARLAVNEGLRDIYWAYLNSSEFSTNH